MSAALTDRHVRETLSRDKLMRFYGVDLSDLRLSFPLPAHLDGERARSRAFSWELPRTRGMGNCSHVTGANALACGSLCHIWVLETAVEQHVGGFSSATLSRVFMGSVVSLFLCSSLAFSAQFWERFPNQADLSGTGTAVRPRTTVVVFQRPIILLKMF